MSLVTLNEIKTFLDIALADTSKDALITLFRDSVEASIIGFCETDFASHIVTNEYIDANRSDIILPKNCPIISVQALYIDVDSDGNGTLLDSSEYVKDGYAITLKNHHTQGRRASIKINYTYGYASVPADVKMCVYQSVKAEIQRYDSNTENINSRSKEGESESYGGAWDGISGLPKQVISKLSRYKMLEFPNVPSAQGGW